MRISETAAMKPMSDVSAAILAGGLGTRLRAEISDKPKVMADVCGRPFITRLIDQLANIGIEEAVLCVGYMAEKIEQSLGNRYGSVRLRYSIEDRPAGTAGALRLAIPSFKGKFILVMNGDSYFDTDLTIFMKWFFEIRDQAGILLTRVDDTSRYGSVEVDHEGKVKAFNEKTKSEGSGWINAGVYMFSKSLITLLPDVEKYSMEREFFPSLIGRGLYGFKADGRFIDIGTPESYSMAEGFFDGPGARHKETII